MLLCGPCVVKQCGKSAETKAHGAKAAEAKAALAKAAGPKDAEPPAEVAVRPVANVVVWVSKELLP
jgi:hypothetical protein